MEFHKLLANAKRNLKFFSQRVSKATFEGGTGYVKLEELLVEKKSWLEALPGEFQKPYSKNLCNFVETEMCGTDGVPIYPPSHLIFNALNYTPFRTVKVVILGQILMSNYYNLCLYCIFSIPSHGNLEIWAVQGVLLLNTILTVRNHQANSHAKKGWEQFTNSVKDNFTKERRRSEVLLLDYSIAEIVLNAAGIEGAKWGT
ncbi:hypothetical protein UlMin_034881 [Ulmus minor]